MNTLNFKHWLEDIVDNDDDAQKQIDADPKLSTIQKKAQVVAGDALIHGKDAVQAVQKMVAKEPNLPTSQMSLMMPKALNAKMKKK